MNIQEKIVAIKNKLLGSGSTASGTFSIIGSLPNACHSLCMSIVSILAFIGITINILPLMFLQTYKLYFWLAAFLLTGASLYFFKKQKKPLTRDRNFIFINTGLLTFGLPFSFIVDYMDFFRFIGLSFVIIGLFLFFFGKKFRFVDQSVSENMQSIASASPIFTLSSVLFALIVGGFLVNQYMMYRLGIFGNMGASVVSTTTSAMNQLSQMKFTPFDVVLAKERMDKNNDGICDACGMPIQQCIDSGQMDCTMGGNKNGIGILGSQHIHSDLKVYVNGQALDFAKPEYYMKSSFMHLDNNQSKEDASSVLHQHAKNVPLWLFFRSLGMNITKDSLTLANGQVLRNENGNSLKFYLNGQKVDELDNYVFQDLDKILISYGSENDTDAQKQVSSVTDFAKNH